MSWNTEAPVDDWGSGSKTKNDFNDGFSADAGGFSDDTAGDAELGDSSGGGGGGGDGACRNCGQDGHFARECPETKKNSGECYNCGETGHNKADCPNPTVERAFNGECRNCGQAGHRAADCPTKAPEICRGCGDEGHKAAECTVNRKMDRSKVADMDKGAAWNLIKEAVADKDMADVKQAIDIYIKAEGDLTYPQLEKRFRDADLPVYCIAQEMEVPQTMSLVNLQGKAGCKFVIGYFFSDKPKRAIFANGWPGSPDENMERLADAGVPMENYVPLCRNCKEMGHTSKACTQEKTEDPSAVTITCSNCNEEGHRYRDCTQEKGKRGGAAKDCRRCGEIGHMAKDCPNAEASGGGGGRACHNCGSEEHMAKECDQPRKQTCRNCNEEGHMSRDCEKPKDPSTTTCRNCDEVGHFSKECPKPRDYSRVKCSRCNEMGHTQVRCKQPAADEDAGAGAGAGADSFDNAGGFGDAGDVGGSAAAGDDTWGGGSAAPVTAGGW